MYYESCELKVCITKKLENLVAFLNLLAIFELSALCIIQAFDLTSEKMFPEIVHKGCFRNFSAGRRRLAVDLVGSDFSDMAYGKVLQDFHRDAEENHVHLINSTDSFHHFFAELFAFHTFYGHRFSFYLKFDVVEKNN